MKRLAMCSRRSASWPRRSRRSACLHAQTRRMRSLISAPSTMLYMDMLGSGAKSSRRSDERCLVLQLGEHQGGGGSVRGRIAPSRSGCAARGARSPSRRIALAASPSRRSRPLAGPRTGCAARRPSGDHAQRCATATRLGAQVGQVGAPVRASILRERCPRMVMCVARPGRAMKTHEARRRAPPVRVIVPKRECGRGLAAPRVLHCLHAPLTCLTSHAQSLTDQMIGSSQMTDPTVHLHGSRQWVT